MYIYIFIGYRGLQDSNPGPLSSQANTLPPEQDSSALVLSCLGLVVTCWLVNVEVLGSNP